MAEKKIIEILADYRGVDPSTITKESTFEGMEIDSLDIVELLMTFEDEFGVTIEMNEKFKSVGDVVTEIESLMA